MNENGLGKYCNFGVQLIINNGSAQGMLSILLPVIFLIIIFYFSHLILGFYGITLLGLGIIYNLPLLMSCALFGYHMEFILGFTVKKFQQKKFENLHNNFPPSYTHNIQHIRKLKQMNINGKVISKVTSGYVILLTSLLSLALYFFFIYKIQLIQKVKLKNPLILIGLVIGSLMPYFISAFLNYGIAKLVTDMIPVLKSNKQPFSIQYEDLQDPRMNKSIYYMIIPLVICLIIPIILSVLLGVSILIGIIPGVVITGFNLGASTWKSGSSWSMVNTFVESEKIVSNEGNIIKYSKLGEKSCIIAQLVGDSVKDLISPALLLIIIVIPVQMILFSQIITNIRI